jgi:hypothetical protein
MKKMAKTNEIRPVFVEYIPEQLSPGILYISKRYSTASHLCCCGCGLEVVTPLNPAKWHLTEHEGIVSLRPSVGNWSFPCQSHYWISGNKVRWAAGMSTERIAAVKARDKRDVQVMVSQEQSLFTRFVTAIGTWLKNWFGR